MKRLTFSRSLAVFAVMNFAIGAMAAWGGDTLAFYPFDEGAAGTTACGHSISNVIDGTYPGVVTVTADTDIVYDDDVPGKYVLDSSFAKTSSPTIVYTNPKSVHFATTGGKIEFPGLSTALSSNEDYTVEFFYKIREEDCRGASTIIWSAVFEYDVGTYFEGYSGATTIPEGHYPVRLRRSTDLYWQIYYGRDAKPTMTDALSYNTKSGWSGDWHHMALVYSKDARTLTCYSDYNQRNRHVVLNNVTNTVLESAVALELGRQAFKGLVTCLRLSKKALAVDDFLHASNLKTYPEETVFHWTCDGVAGTSAEVVTNVAFGGHPYAGQFEDWDTTTTLYSGNGTIHTASKEMDDGTVTLTPQFTSVLPFKKMDLVSYDGVTNSNPGSLRLDVLKRTDEATGLSMDGSGVYLSGKDHQFVNGSFTMEVTMKLDYTDWRSQVGDYMTRYTIFALYADTIYTSDFQLSAIQDGDGYFRITGYAYLSEPRENVKFCNINGDVGQRQGCDINFLRDGAWHHFALVYDDSDYTFKVYVDYELKTTYQANRPYRPINQSTYNRNYWFGSNTMKHSGFQGWMDEARMTRRALAPSEFIRFSRRTYGTMLLVK